MTFELTSSAFSSNGKIPTKYTGEGENVSPPLAWRDAPKGTAEFALIVDDPDAPQSKPFVHWVRYAIPKSATSLAEDDKAMGVDGSNEKGGTGWTGPMPPPGHGPHHYQFHLYALSNKVPLAPGASKMELLMTIQDRTLGEARLVGVYERARVASTQH
jgi:Raf kinase inhibitor-like YbhB/YbcL family protein